MAVKVRQNADRILQLRRVGVKIKDKASLGSVSDSMKELQLRGIHEIVGVIGLRWCGLRKFRWEQSKPIRQSRFCYKIFLSCCYMAFLYWTCFGVENSKFEVLIHSLNLIFFSAHTKSLVLDLFGSFKSYKNIPKLWWQLKHEVLNSTMATEEWRMYLWVLNNHRGIELRRIRRSTVGTVSKEKRTTTFDLMVSWFLSIHEDMYGHYFMPYMKTYGHYFWAYMKASKAPLKYLCFLTEAATMKPYSTEFWASHMCYSCF